MTTGEILRAAIELRKKTKLGLNHLAMVSVLINHMNWGANFEGAKKGQIAITLRTLYEEVGVSRRQCLKLLREIEHSAFGLVRTRKKHGGYHIFELRGLLPCEDGQTDCDQVKKEKLPKGNKKPYIYKSQININILDLTHKNIFMAGYDSIVRKFKVETPASNVDVQKIWEEFIKFNLKNNNSKVPVRFLIGFLRNWNAGLSTKKVTSPPCPTQKRDGERHPISEHVKQVCRLDPFDRNEANRKFMELPEDLQKILLENAQNLLGGPNAFMEMALGYLLHRASKKGLTI